MDVDDTFTPDDAWSTTTHATTTPTPTRAHARRRVDNAAEWSQANNFRIDQLFNGGGSVEYQAKMRTPPAPTRCSPSSRRPTRPPASPTPTTSAGSATPRTPPTSTSAAPPRTTSKPSSTRTRSGPRRQPGATPGTGGLGLTASTDTALALGAENPQVFVPGQPLRLRRPRAGQPRPRSTRPTSTTRPPAHRRHPRPPAPTSTRSPTSSTDRLARAPTSRRPTSPRRSRSRPAGR